MKQHNTSLGNPFVLGNTLSKLPKGVWIGLGGLAIYMLWKANQTANSVLEKIGLKDDFFDHKKKDFQQSLNYRTAFSPEYYKHLGPHRNYTDQQAKGYAQKIYDSFGFFNDNEESVIGVFRTAQSLAHISKLSDYYLKYHNEDLWGRLQDNLNNKELFQIINILEKLPKSI